MRYSAADGRQVQPSLATHLTCLRQSRVAPVTKSDTQNGRGRKGCLLCSLLLAELLVLLGGWQEEKGVVDCANMSLWRIGKQSTPGQDEGGQVGFSGFTVRLRAFFWIGNGFCRGQESFRTFLLPAPRIRLSLSSLTTADCVSFFLSSLSAGTELTGRRMRLEAIGSSESLSSRKSSLLFHNEGRDRRCRVGGRRRNSSGENCRRLLNSPFLEVRENWVKSGAGSVAVAHGAPS